MNIKLSELPEGTIAYNVGIDANSKAVKQIPSSGTLAPVYSIGPIITQIDFSTVAFQNYQVGQIFITNNYQFDPNSRMPNTGLSFIKITNYMNDFRDWLILSSGDIIGNNPM